MIYSLLQYFDLIIVHSPYSVKYSIGTSLLLNPNTNSKCSFLDIMALINFNVQFFFLCLYIFLISEHCLVCKDEFAVLSDALVYRFIIGNQ